jgi:hypothetical protein
MFIIQKVYMSGLGRGPWDLSRIAPPFGSPPIGAATYQALRAGSGGLSTSCRHAGILKHHDYDFERKEPILWHPPI